MTKTLKSLGKHPYRPWQMTFFIFNNLCVFLAPSCIFVQRWKFLRWRDAKLFLQNGIATRKAQISLPLTFFIKEQYAASFHRSRFNYVVRSVKTPHFHSHFSSKNVLLMSQSDLDPWTIDLKLYVNFPIEMLYQYKYVSKLERLNYGTIKCLRKGSAHRCKISYEQEQSLMEMTSNEHKLILKMNVSYLHNMKCIQFFHKWLKWSYSPFPYILFCKFTPLDIRLVHTIVFCRKSKFRK